MVRVLNLYKRSGETPLERLGRLRNVNKLYRNETLSYAGRLDPLAEGVLLVLVGAENKKRDHYNQLPKEYEAEILLGVSTDAFDPLGIVQKVDHNIKKVDSKKIAVELKKTEGGYVQSYPPFSSKAVEGKPLFWWAREQRLNEIQLPTKEVFIYSADLIGERMVGSKELLRIIDEKILLVRGDFRQSLIRKSWATALSGEEREYQIIKIRIVCSSGTYVRVLANRLGDGFGVPAIAFHIIRTRVGSYDIKDSLR
jgi:tRNA pseudouridine55 synthase